MEFIRIVSDGMDHKVLDDKGQILPGVTKVEIFLKPGEPAHASLTVMEAFVQLDIKCDKGERK